MAVKDIPALAAAVALSDSDIAAITQGSNVPVRTTLVAIKSYVGGWTRVKLGTNFTNSTTSDNAVTGLKFTPVASTQYDIRGRFYLKTAVATTGPQPGISFPTGLTWQAGQIAFINSSTVNVFASFGGSTTIHAASTGIPDNTNAYQGQLNAGLLAGVSPSGDFQITLASENGGDTVTMLAGSFIEYRVIN